MTKEEKQMLELAVTLRAVFIATLLLSAKIPRDVVTAEALKILARFANAEGDKMTTEELALEIKAAVAEIEFNAS